MSKNSHVKIDPDSRWFVILSSDDNVIGKFDTNAPMKIPKSVGEFDVVELPDRQSLADYSYNEDLGFQTV